jgi:preprotein translocase subunit SecE
LGVQIPPGLPPGQITAVTQSECLMREYVEKVTTFLQDVHAETKKVTWPSRKDVLGSTLVVIVAVFIIAGYLGIVDFVLSLIIGSLIK